MTRFDGTSHALRTQPADRQGELPQVSCRIFLSWKDAGMPKKIDVKVKERCVRLVLDHVSEYPSLTAAAEAVARREGVGKESVRRWVLQAQIDGGQRQGMSTTELAEIKELRAKVRRLEEDNEILRRASIFFAGELDPRNR